MENGLYTFKPSQPYSFTCFTGYKELESCTTSTSNPNDSSNCLRAMIEKSVDGAG